MFCILFGPEDCQTICHQPFKIDFRSVENVLRFGLSEVCFDNFSSRIPDAFRSQRQKDIFFFSLVARCRKFIRFALKLRIPWIEVVAGISSYNTSTIPFWNTSTKMRYTWGGSNPLKKYGLVWVKYGFSMGWVRVWKNRVFMEIPIFSFQNNGLVWV